MPLPYYVQMFGFFPFTCSGKLITGIILMVAAVVNLPALPVWWIVVLIPNIIISIVIVIALSYLISSLTFYAPVQCEEISTTVRFSVEYTSTFPLSGMPLYIQLPLLSIFPAGLIAWLPSLIILGKISIITNIYPIIIAALFSSVASYCFKKGFRYYVTKGINRYHPGGHRG